MSTWKTLSAIDCSKHVEKKGNLSYLSWAWAWSTLMEHYPDASYTYCPPSFLENGTCEVNVSVTIEGKTHSMWLPCMDNRNKSLANPSSRDISDARMRCLVKAIAMHGLGAYIYAGEDLPQAVQTAVVSEDQAEEIKMLLAEYEIDVKKFLSHFKSSSVDEMLAVHYSKAINALKAKAK
jgi:hypothetical protein